MLFLTLILGALWGCDQTAERPQSNPVSSSNKTAGGTVDMAIDLEGPKPVGTAELKTLFPQLSALTTAQVQLVAGVINIVPSPCEPCGDIPLAHCAQAGNITTCGALNKLVSRAVFLTTAGQQAGHVKASVNYPDLWFDDMGSGSPVQVIVYQDAQGGFAKETAEAVSALQGNFGDKIAVTLHDADVAAPAPLGVRSRPTFFINGHRFRGAQTPKTLGRFVAFELMEATP